jgi:hypothetical protein
MLYENQPAIGFDSKKSLVVSELIAERFFTSRARVSEHPGVLKYTTPEDPNVDSDQILSTV